MTDGTARQKDKQILSRIKGRMDKGLNGKRCKGTKNYAHIVFIFENKNAQIYFIADCQLGAGFGRAYCA